MGAHTRGDSLGFKYTEGASHSQDSALGVGLSGYGFDAGYTSAGSQASTATRAEGYPPVHGNASFLTLGQFRRTSAVFAHFDRLRPPAKRGASHDHG